MNPAPGTRPAWVDDALFPFESRFVELGGHVVHYIDEGTGPTLLLLHGNPTWSFLHRDLIPLLSHRFRCVALDYPGFGLSSAAPGYRYLPEEHAEVVQALVEHLDLRGYVPVVQDWGGPIGLAVAVRGPERVRGLVVGNTWGWRVDRDPWFVAFSHLMGGPLGRLLIGRANLFVERLIPAGHRRRTLGETEMAHYRAPFPDEAARAPTHVLPRRIVMSNALLDEVQRDLPGLAAKPALIVWGDRDIAFRSRERRRWERTLPDATTVILEGAGHYIQDDAPDDLAAAIHRWWETSVEPDRAPRA